MNITSECMECLLRRNLATARRYGDEVQVTAFAKDMMRMFLEGPEEMAAPFYSMHTTDLLRKHFGLPEDRYRQEKQEANRFALENMELIRQTVRSGSDPLYAGLQCAILGNYLDYSALQGEVSLDKLTAMLSNAKNIQVDKDNFESLRSDLKKGRSLLYLTDNAGEIGFDRVFAEEIHRQFPQLSITFCVRGGYALNDATRADAELIGIPFPVIDNGNRVAGTVISMAGPALQAELSRADVIIAKGQANVETMLGCGLNVYYAFLVKCQRFIDIFGKEKLTPMLHKEQSSAVCSRKQGK